MAKIKQFEDLECWRTTRELIKHVYLLCKNESLKNDFNTAKQLRTAALSTMNNIAEGFARYNKKDFI
jgi:four helix bundle protein